MSNCIKHPLLVNGDSHDFSPLNNQYVCSIHQFLNIVSIHAILVETTLGHGILTFDVLLDSIWFLPLLFCEALVFLYFAESWLRKNAGGPDVYREL